MSRRPIGVLLLTVSSLLGACGDGESFLPGAAGAPGEAGAPPGPGGPGGKPAVSEPPTSRGHGATVGDCGAFTGTPIYIATDQAGPGYLASDETFLYWAQANIESHSIWRAPKLGGGTPKLLGDLYSTYGVALGESQAYWALYDNAGAIVRTPKTGGTAVTVVAQQPRVTDLVVDGEDLFWLATGTIQGSYQDGRVMTWREGMAAPVVLAEERRGVAQLSVAGDSVFWVDRLDDGTPAILRVGRGGGAVEPVVTSASGVTFAVDDDTLYWSNGEGIWRQPQAGGAPEKISSHTPQAFLAQAFGGCVYFGGINGLSRVSKQGGPLAIGQTFYPSRMLVDEGGIYASVGEGRTDGYVVRVPFD